MSCFVLVVVSPSNPDLLPTESNLADGAVGFQADGKALAGRQPSGNLDRALPAPGEGASHDQKAARSKGESQCLRWIGCMGGAGVGAHVEGDRSWDALQEMKGCIQDEGVLGVMSPQGSTERSRQ